MTCHNKNEQHITNTNRNECIFAIAHMSTQKHTAMLTSAPTTNQITIKCHHRQWQRWIIEHDGCKASKCKEQIHMIFVAFIQTWIDSSTASNVQTKEKFGLMKHSVWVISICVHNKEHTQRKLWSAMAWMFSQLHSSTLILHCRYACDFCSNCQSHLHIKWWQACWNMQAQQWV